MSKKERINKDQFITIVAERTGKSKKEIKEIYNEIENVIIEYVSDNIKVHLVGLGTFMQRSRAARRGVNPQTKNHITITEQKIAAFQPGKRYKDSVKGKR